MKTATSHPDIDVVRCVACGTENRVPRAKIRHGLRPICGRCKAPLVAEGRPVTVSDATFASTVAAAPLPVLLDLWAPWCGPCRMVAPVIEQIARERAGRVLVGKLDVDENPATASRFGVRSIPTLLILRGGREVDRIVGAVPKEEILRRLDVL
jgi:thioredoxin 2